MNKDVFYTVRDNEKGISVVSSEQKKRILEDKKQLKLKDEDVNLDKKDFVVYNIITTSDKEINFRIYPHDKVLDTVLEKKWLERFPKPFIKGHSENNDALARVKSASYVNHKSLEVIAGDEVPKKVLDYFNKKKCFVEGTGSVIGTFVGTKDFYQQVADGVILTTSQSSYTNGYTCNICDNSLFSNECDHWQGQSYMIEQKDGSKEKKRCIPSTHDLFPVENSSVIDPANDVSITVLYNTKKDEVLTIEDSLNLNSNKTSNKDSKNKKSKEAEMVSDKKNKEGGDMDKEKTEKMEKSIKDNMLPIFAKDMDEEKTKNMKKVIDNMDPFILADTLNIVKIIRDFKNDEIESIKEKHKEKISELKDEHKEAIVELKDTHKKELGKIKDEKEEDEKEKTEDEHELRDFVDNKTKNKRSQKTEDNNGIDVFEI